METKNGFFATKRCSNYQEGLLGHDYNIPFQDKFDGLTHRYPDFHSTHPLHTPKDEPIDLTFPTREVDENTRTEDFNNCIPKLEFPVTFPHGNFNGSDSHSRIRQNYETILEAQPFEINNYSEKVFTDHQATHFPKQKRKRRKLVYTKEGNLILLTEDSSQTATSFTPTKQLEILKAAKSLFSKRTRTLYHWMYPNAAKQQIKTAVTASWESLAENEKEFYISQVLGRFGFLQTNLMINPQLGSMKQLLPPPPEKVHMKPMKRELENAISSITPTTTIETDTKNMSFEEFEKISERSRKRRGRPRSFNVLNEKRTMLPSGDFQDDPELSQELEKFALKFKLNKY